jgi:hypothetical protein
MMIGNQMMKARAAGNEKILTTWLKFLAEFCDTHAVGNRSEDEDGNHRALIRMLLEHIRSNAPDDKSKEILPKILCPTVSIVDGFGHYTAADYLDEGYDSKYVKFRKERSDRKIVEVIRERQRIHNGTPVSIGSGGGPISGPSSTSSSSSSVGNDTVLSAVWSAATNLIPGSDLNNVGRSVPRLASLGGVGGGGGGGFYPRSMGMGMGMGMGGGGGMRGACSNCMQYGHFFRNCPMPLQPHLQAKLDQQAATASSMGMPLSVPSGPRALLAPGEVMMPMTGVPQQPMMSMPSRFQQPFTPGVGAGAGYRGGLALPSGFGPRPMM